MGKTRISLEIIQQLYELGEIQRTLVVAPLRPVYAVWPNEIAKWGVTQSWSILHGQLHQAIRQNAQIEIINPAGLPKLFERKGRKLKRLFPRRWDLLIVDESTGFKTWGALRSKLIRALLPDVRKRLILTGTPTAQSLADLHGQMFIVDDGESLGASARYFRREYMYKGGFKGRQWLLMPGQEAKLQAAIADRVLRMEACDYLDMPELVYNDIWVRMPEAVMPEYRRLKRDLLAKLQSGDVFAKTAASAYGKCRQFANGAVYDNDDSQANHLRPFHKPHDEKVSALAELCDELNGKSVMIAFQFGHDLRRLKAHRYFADAPVIAGRDELGKILSAKTVDAIVEKWNSGGTRFLLVQPQSMSHGLNLQFGGHDIAWFGLTDSAEVYRQLNARIYRQGATGQVRVHHILTAETVDEIMLARLRQKGQDEASFLEALKAHASS